MERGENQNLIEVANISFIFTLNSNDLLQTIH